MASSGIELSSLKVRKGSGKVYFTYTDIVQRFSEWPETPVIEIFKGELYVAPSPNLYHQEISGKLEFLLRSYINENDLGWLYDAPTDVVFNEENTTVPDLLFVKKSDKHKLQKTHIRGAPDFIIEILSSNRDNDLKLKKELYGEFGVKEYWIVDPIDKQILKFLLKNDKLQLVDTMNHGDIINSEVLSFEINLDDIF